MLQFVLNCAVFETTDSNYVGVTVQFFSFPPKSNRSDILEHGTHHRCYIYNLTVSSTLGIYTEKFHGGSKAAFFYVRFAETCKGACAEAKRLAPRPCHLPLSLQCGFNIELRRQEMFHSHFQVYFSSLKGAVNFQIWREVTSQETEAAQHRGSRRFTLIGQTTPILPNYVGFHKFSSESESERLWVSAGDVIGELIT